MKLFEKAPAKINLTLDVIGKRDDGYHEIEMIMTTIDLADRISFEEIEGNQIILESNSGIVPNDERNLVYKSAKLIKSKFNIDKGVKIYLEKNIPVAAGLAGGSSDAAATLRGLNRLWKLGLSEKELMELGEEIGSDVPFCVVGGTALATGRGEKIQKITSVPSGWVILAKLPIGVSTSVIYNALKLDEIKEHPKTEQMIKAIEDQDFSMMTKLLSNVLENVTFSLYPQVKQLYKQMKQFSGEGVLMSGSGPTVYALVNMESRKNRIYNALRGFCKEVYAVRLLR
ncbi:4-(cytidine 5'-diphospho)-2-C-methyl-D-erythritol kinase [Vulcanibacillus modesticaldus]|uniref:4-diphosphocytidyl-2-C-methyl-D-erythritol kinase n=1 Tax=Vulcanibacillus modesticaldus TaxID=337097 RepID=A0A1D2YXF3_9BACI|nr:4-(cytidine 5'-diphospho)-2-C-methyl-D-erythritol kinase [Vulcanibacillus modesticaldus]OEG00286.1 4-(cytidine 5'-diphospho)-2-C-methyl-D-erythritol kinase [Vulcanibacillus modesticaldus]